MADVAITHRVVRMEPDANRTNSQGASTAVRCCIVFVQCWLRNSVGCQHWSKVRVWVSTLASTTSVPAFWMRSVSCFICSALRCPTDGEAWQTTQFGTGAAWCMWEGDWIS